ncbi:MAG: ComF family protein [Luteitalea sp.]|nr:ComF family protein [Luteitalea sp.]
MCGACWQSILPLTPPLCDLCGDPLPGMALGRCPRCRRSPQAVDRARAIGPYEGTLRDVIHALKYDARRSLARPLARLLRERGADVLAGADAVIPVPLHSSRRRERGFNQAADIARHIAAGGATSDLTDYRLPIVHALRRVRATAPQAGLSAGRRHSNVRDAFAVTAACQGARGRIVVLVDDVSTTGATLDVCARTLKAAGVAEVRALTAARVVTSPR